MLFAVGGVDTSLDRNADHGVMGVGTALLCKRLDVAVAVLVDVVHHPRLPHLAARLFQVRLRTDIVSLQCFRTFHNMCEYGDATET
jgi:hypothetical protein